ncbi:MAG: phosphotransferase family protein [Actinomycetia bacterium]|nr:phosphotransferase family protein [Actinomycetes bacterium]
MTGMEMLELERRLVAFCQDRYQDLDAAVHDLVSMPGHAGFSYGFSATSGGTTDRWLIRLPPPDVRWEGTADLTRQVVAIEALEDSSVPHCRVRWWGGSDDLEWFDSPYFVTPFLDGVEPVGLGTKPWAHELPDRTRASMAHQAMTALAGIHGVDWQERCSGLGAAVDLRADVVSWDRFLDRVAEPDRLVRIPEIRDRLLETLPTTIPVGLCHGDYQFGNLLYSPDGALAAVIDWELCGIGATTTDLGWMALFNEPEAWRHEGATPPGMAEADELLALYTEIQGAEPVAIDWFRAQAAYKFAIITGFNLALHRRGKRPDPWWEEVAASLESLQDHALGFL